MCGEHANATSPNPGSIGSSPRVRGTRACRGTVRAAGRFIPACAGNTCCHAPLSEGHTVHPRVCGEHHPRSIMLARKHGSSPRVRGTQPHEDERGRGRRFIPACAGNTSHPLFFLLFLPVHPRVCGEHSSISLANRSRCGSSPRVRGTRHAHRHRHASLRFIPACAGNTPAVSCRPHTGPVHPRVCGEHSVHSLFEWPFIGSSPRVRGTRRPWTPRTPRFRFIPACAGNTVARHVGLRRIAVHPRVCGEHPSHPILPGADYGSSPRVRGTRRFRGSSLYRSRFIPACAGNTPFHKSLI